MRDNLPQEAWPGKEIGVKHGYQLALGSSKTGGQRPSFEAAPIRPRDVNHIDPLALQISRDPPHHLARLIGRIVENLDL
jgi:hypothetical protein